MTCFLRPVRVDHPVLVICNLVELTGEPRLKTDAVCLRRFVLSMGNYGTLKNGFGKVVKWPWFYIAAMVGLIAAPALIPDLVLFLPNQLM